MSTAGAAGNRNPLPLADGTKSNHVRCRVVAFTVALASMTYLDRVCIGILAPSIMQDLRVTPIQMSAAHAFSRWIPARKCGRVQGIFFAGAHLAGGLTQALAAFLATVVPWRFVCLFLRVVGLAWATGW